jgi:hypothetical protein
MGCSFLFRNPQIELNIFNFKYLVSMNGLSLICSVFLLVALAPLPSGFYTFLRIVVFIGALVIAFGKHASANSLLRWGFIAIAVLFNPIIPVYLYEKGIWMPIDIIAAIAFAAYSFNSSSKSKV